ncbi:phage integrase SAM-like domain-containing protein [Sphingobacterium hotanense]|uniref:Phage integrase SAM-like domain-containing protein n=1 Tax=Sphingobacterium hotanense TaxID=649196 RepID=A0ABT7NQF1_9SPHI|nr:phage integrase SAM-like domain-containing protein [Sphingobacterium hotanense]MDM1049399.1 phage integrase SAM-like domain-containing protein [Sphingobacterium hotanense]
MATIKPVVRKTNKRTDGTWRVSYRLYHGKILYIPTTHYVGPDSIDKDTDEIKEEFVTNYIAEELKTLRKNISQLGRKIDLMSCEKLREYLVKIDDTMDFFKFSTLYIGKIVDKKSESSKVTYTAVINNLKLYHKFEELSPLEITEHFVADFEYFLLYDKQNPVKPSTVNIYIQLFKKMFKEMKKKFNNAAIGDIKIPHDPFEGWERLKKNKVRSRELDIEMIRKIRDIDTKINKTDKRIGQDCFMLIFMMLGMNLKDIWNNIPDLEDDALRIDYNRSKTKGRRVDEAFISVAIPEEARPYIKRVKDFLKRKNYTTYNSFYHAVKTKLVVIGDELGIDSLGTYHARHSFSNIAVNKLGVDYYHISLALNHIDGLNSSTRHYIKPNWTFIDNAQRKVIDYLYADQKNEPKSVGNIFSKINLKPLK